MSEEIFSSLLSALSLEDSRCELDEVMEYYLEVILKCIMQAMKDTSIQSIIKDPTCILAVQCCTAICGDQKYRDVLYARLQERSELAEFVRAMSEVAFDQTLPLDVRSIPLCLLCNLTQSNEWSSCILQSTASSSFWKCLPNYAQETLYMQLFLNLSSCAEMRNLLCCDEKPIIGELFCQCSVEVHKSLYLSLLGTLKNCCFDDGLHYSLCQAHACVFEDLLVHLCGPDDYIDQSDLEKLSPQLRCAFGNQDSKRETVNAIKLTACEAMLQLCSTCLGRSHLRSLGAYYVLRELHKYECGKEQELLSNSASAETTNEQRKLIFTVEQVVDQLICEEYERPNTGACSLRSIEIDSGMETKLQKVRDDFISGI